MEKQSDRIPLQESKDELNDSNDGETISDVGRHHLYSEEEAACLEEKLNNKETFREALPVLITWLEKGLCNEGNFARFHTLILTCLNRVNKLGSEQKECLDEVQKVGNKICSIQLQLNKIEEVFKEVEKEGILDKFTEDQRNKLEEMKRDILDFKHIMKGYVERKVDEVELTSMKTVQNEEIGGSSTSGLDHKRCLNEISRLNSELENSRKRRKKYPSEMEMISYLSVFLYKNPKVTIECIYHHFEKVSTRVEIENLMRRYPKIFEESSDDQVKKWKLVVETVDPKTFTALNNKQQLD